MTNVIDFSQYKKNNDNPTDSPTDIQMNSRKLQAYCDGSDSCKFTKKLYYRFFSPLEVKQAWKDGVMVGNLFNYD